MHPLRPIFISFYSFLACVCIYMYVDNCYPFLKGLMFIYLQGVLVTLAIIRGRNIIVMKILFLANIWEVWSMNRMPWEAVSWQHHSEFSWCVDLICVEKNYMYYHVQFLGKLWRSWLVGQNKINRCNMSVANKTALLVFTLSWAHSQGYKHAFECFWIRILFHRSCETEMRLASGRHARLYYFLLFLLSENLKIKTLWSIIAWVKAVMTV